MKITSPLSAFALLAGLVLGFFGAVLVGRQASGYSKPSNFKRFHFSISPETNFFPTFSMMENLALARWHPGQTVVIVGGNSIFNGVGQSESQLWTDRLQKELGEHYVVVNLAFRGAYASEGAALVAESLLRQGVPTIYVADVGPGNCNRPFGSIYGYLYWDARAKDRLLYFPERDAFVETWLKMLPEAERMKQEELRRAARLDAVLHFQSLWHHVGYRHVFSVWSSVLRDEWWKRRDRFPDPEPGPPPLSERFHHSFDGEMDVVRNYTATKAESDGRGGWRALEIPLQSLDEEIDTVFPPVMRPHILMVMTQSCPIFRNKLTPSETARDVFVYATYRDKWREKGIACEIMGEDFLSEDYADRCHIGPGGGDKLAVLVAAEVRKLNKR